jgi:hypothetical protein
MTALQSKRAQIESLDAAVEMAEVVGTLPFEVKLWHAQNIWYEILESHHSHAFALAVNESVSWQARFEILGRLLNIAVDDLVLEDEGASK